jgi:hypothetical protein
MDLINKNPRYWENREDKFNSDNLENWDFSNWATTSSLSVSINIANKNPNDWENQTESYSSDTRLWNYSNWTIT